MAEYYGKCLSENFELEIDVYNPKRERDREDWVKASSNINAVESIKKYYEYAVVACPWNKIKDYILENKIRAGNILYEKPIATTSAELQEIRKISSLERRYVAFNRRFYETTERIKEICQNEEIKYARLTITDSPKLFNTKYGTEGKNRFFHYQYCHYIDLLMSIFGEINNIREIISDKCYIIEIKDGEVVVEILTGLSRNCSLEIAMEDGRNILMSPIEKLEVMEGMTQEYSKQEKIRVWKPRKKEKIICSSEYKPGMLTMLTKFVQGKGDKLCTLREGVKVHELIEEILKKNE